MLSKPVRILEDFEPPVVATKVRRRLFGWVFVGLWVQQEEFITAIITATARTDKTLNL